MDTFKKTMSKSVSNANKNKVDNGSFLANKRAEVTAKALALMRKYSVSLGISSTCLFVKEVMCQDMRSRGIPFLDPFMRAVVNMCTSSWTTA